MLRFLILCTVFFLLYLGFNTIGEFDSRVEFSILNYHIDTTIFTFASIFLIVQLLLMIILKTVFLIFDLPSIIRDGWNRRKLKRINEQLVRTISELLMGNKTKSLEITSKLLPDFDANSKELSSLILAESENGFDAKIQHLRALLDKKNYSLYASKKLAQVFYDNGHYKEAEDYANKAFNEKDTDAQLMIMLIRIYAKIGSWSKMILIGTKLQRADIKLFNAHSNEIAGYYYLAAKHALSSGNDSEATNLLESALTLKPDSLEALMLFTELSINTNNSTVLLKVLKSAFTNHPSFEIAQMYAKCSRNSPNMVYGTLASLVKPSENVALFLSIAAYLGLYEKIDDLKDPKLINDGGK